MQADAASQASRFPDRTFQRAMAQRMRSAVQTAVEVVALAVFWIACVATTRPDELIVGVAAVALSSAFCMFTIRTLPLHFRPAPRDLAQAARVPGNILTDLGVVARVLLRGPLGKGTPSLFRAAPWRSTGNSGRSTAKRALAIACTTLSPNCIVVGIDCENGRILLHQLEKTDIPLLLRRLGAGGAR